MTRVPSSRTDNRRSYVLTACPRHLLAGGWVAGAGNLS